MHLWSRPDVPPGTSPFDESVESMWHVEAFDLDGAAGAESALRWAASRKRDGVHVVEVFAVLEELDGQGRGLVRLAGHDPNASVGRPVQELLNG